MLATCNLLYKVNPATGLVNHHLKSALHLTCGLNHKKHNFAKWGHPPLHNEDRLNEVKESEIDLEFTKIRFARIWENNSVFFDDVYESYLRHMMHDGRRDLMYKLLNDCHYEIKCKQYPRWKKHIAKKQELENKKDTDPKAAQQLKELDEENVDLDPMSIMHKALENCQPQVITKTVTRGGNLYQVPFPVTASQSEWLAMWWMNKAIKERPKRRTKHYSEVLAWELLDASENKGKVIKQRDDVHRLAQANKAYSHYRWG